MQLSRQATSDPITLPKGTTTNTMLPKPKEPQLQWYTVQVGAVTHIYITDVAPKPPRVIAKKAKAR